MYYALLPYNNMWRALSQPRRKIPWAKSWSKLTFTFALANALGFPFCLRGLLTTFSTSGIYPCCVRSNSKPRICSLTLFVRLLPVSVNYPPRRCKNPWPTRLISHMHFFITITSFGRKQGWISLCQSWYKRQALMYWQIRMTPGIHQDWDTKLHVRFIHVICSWISISISCASKRLSADCSMKRRLVAGGGPGYPKEETKLRSFFPESIISDYHEENMNVWATLWLFSLSWGKTKKTITWHKGDNYIWRRDWKFILKL